MTTVNVKYHWPQHYRSALTFIGVLSAIVLFQWWFVSSDESINENTTEYSAAFSKSTSTSDIEPSAFDDLTAAALAPVPVIESSQTISSQQKQRIANGDSDVVKAELLSDALEAVINGDQSRLADQVSQIGQVALEDWDTDSALVYLSEALAIYEELENDAGIAHTNLQLGRLHIIERRRARRAALAYDQTLLANWYIAKDRFHDAQELLVDSIDQNLSLNRHGAAAEGYESLVNGYRKNGDLGGAWHAAKEATLLHASSGQLVKANALLERMSQDGISREDIAEVRSRLAQLNLDYEDSVSHLGQAADHDRLYNHYIHAGDPVSAWRFRIESNALLAQSSKRARYRRQSGVLVLLYDSNDSLTQAKLALQRAESLTVQMESDRENQKQQQAGAQGPTLAEQARQLMQEIY